MIPKKLKYLLPLILLLILQGGLFSYVNFDLQLNKEKHPHLLPIQSRLPEPKFEPGTTGVMLLEWDSLNITRKATPNFSKNYIELEEKVVQGKIYKPRIVSISDYMDHMQNRLWLQKGLNPTRELEGEEAGGVVWDVPIDLPESLEGIIGEGGASLKVTGMRKITIEGESRWTEGDIRRAGHKVSKFPALDMKQKSRFNISGSIGDKINVDVDQDSERLSELKNNINLKYEGTENDIVQKVEAGNTNLQLKNTQLVGYSRNVKGLFGIKSDLQIGDLSIKAIASQEKGQQHTATFRAGASSEKQKLKDYDYLRRTYFFLGDTWRSQPFTAQDSIIDLKLYIDDGNQLNNLRRGAVQGIAKFFPQEFDDTLREDHRGNFHQLDVDKYYVHRTQGWIRFEQRRGVGENEVLGAQYIVEREDGSIDTVGGYRDDSTLVLKLIKAQDMDDDMHCWKYEWKNVYFLGSEDLSEKDLNMEILRGIVSQENTITKEGGDKYLQVFGLDQTGEGTNQQPDGKVDRIRVDYARGELIFPALHPFNPDSIDERLVSTLTKLDTVSDSIYTDAPESEIQENSVFTIRANVKSVGATHKLKHANIIKGSESVRLNGEELKQGQDYRMNYFTGKLTFLTEEAMDPNANITVDYDYEPFFQVEQKSLLGARAEYDIGENSSFGTMALYKGVSTAEDRPRVGGEPSRSFIWEADMSAKYKPQMFTDWVNALPFIKTDAKSKFELTGEVAAVKSNPNTIGEAFIDDFEGARRKFGLGIVRTVWDIASPPKEYNHSDRGRLWWYNPYDRIPVNNIWPDKEVRNEYNDVNVLTLSYKDTADAGPESWGGVMRELPEGYRDQQEAQFLEVWVKGDKGVLHLDMGEISEDIDQDDELDTEDTKDEAGYRDGILQKEEDTGLDGVFDSEEDSVWAGGTPDDPHGDNWSYDSEEDEDDYSHINGTENNHLDPEGGKRPDTEDLNNNGGLDLTNNYYGYDIDLENDRFLVEGTRSPEGWRLYRVPLKDSIFQACEHCRRFRRRKVGNPDFRDMEFVRLWTDGFGDNSQHKVSIAEMNIVSYVWKPQSKDLKVTVKNTHENTEYEPPPGVAGERDESTGIRMAEQSLALQYSELPGTTEAYAKKQLAEFEENDYTFYSTLKMYVKFNSEISEGARPYFFLRIGTNKNNFYEFRERVEPGWSPAENTVEMDIPKITAFKNKLIEKVERDTTLSEGDIDSLISVPGGYYRVKGTPTFSNVRQIMVGVYNPDSLSPISGEVLVDELILEDVRKEPGWAQRADLNMKFADLVKFNGSLDNNDADFHDLNKKRGDGQNETVGNISTDIMFGKFFPDGVGVSLPVRLGFRQKRSIPRLMTGSDIVVPDSLREEEKTDNTNISFNTKLQIQPETKNPLVNLTVARMKHTFSYNHNYIHKPNTPLDDKTKFKVQQRYNLSPENDFKVPFLNWASESLPGKLSDAKLNLAPSKFNLNTTVTGSRKTQLDRAYNRTTNKKRDLSHKLIFNTAPFKNFTTNFQLNMNRDLRENFTLGPEGIIMGVLLDKKITNGFEYRPKFWNFLDQKYSWKNNFQLNSDPSRFRDMDIFGSGNLSRKFNINWTLRLDRLLKGSKGRRGPGARRSPRGRGKKKKEEKKEKEEKEKEEKKTEEEGEGSFFGGAFTDVADNLKDIRFQYTRDEKYSQPGLVDKPSLFYQLGFSNDPRTRTKNNVSSGGTQNKSKTISNNYSLKSGIKFPWDINTSIKVSYRDEYKEASNTSKNTSLILPDTKTDFNKIGDLYPFDQYAKSANLTNSFRHEISNSYQNASKTSTKSVFRFKPLLSLRTKWTKRLSSKASFEYTITTKENLQTQRSINQTRKSSLNLGASYSFKAPHGIQLPLIGEIKFNNKLNLSLDVSRSTTYGEHGTSEKVMSPNKDKVKFQVTPKANYNFSKNIKAGLQGNWTDIEDRMVDKKTHERGLNIWAEIHF